MSPYSIILADDHTALRQNLKNLLAQNKDLEVIGEAVDGVGLLDLLKRAERTPDLVIVDITMPGLGGIETTRRIKESYPDAKMLILTIHREREYVEKAFSAGAEGYLLKDQMSGELFSAIDKIREGKLYVSLLDSGSLADEGR